MKRMKRMKTPKQTGAAPYGSWGNQHEAIDAAIKRDAEARKLARATEGRPEPVDGTVTLDAGFFSKVEAEKIAGALDKRLEASIRNYDQRMIEALGMSPRFVSLDDVKALQNQPERESKVD